MVKAKRSARWLLLLAGLFATLAVVLFINHVHAAERQFGEFVEVVVARKDIPMRVPITEEMVDVTPIPLKYVRPGMVTKVEDVLGKVSLVAIGKDQLITESALRTEVMPKGMRPLAMTLAQNVLFDLDLKAGDRVDVLAAFKEDGNDVSKVVMEDLEVVGLSSEGKLRQLTLLVSVEDAPRLMWMENYGKQVRFVRRRFDSGGS